MKRFLSLLLVFAMLSAMIPLHSYAAEIQADMGADYSEITDEIDNPERGFYGTCYIHAAPNANEPKAPKDKLVHMRIDIGCFSHNYLNHIGTAPEDHVEGGWSPLSDDFLNALDRTMANIRSNRGSAIIRFAYDGFEGVADMEPSMEGILSHIAQLKSFFASNADVITAVESGFLGCWGEQHTSTIVDRAHRAQSIPMLVNALLDAVPAPITVSVRRPVYYCYAAGISLESLEDHRADPDSPYYRVGVFNDGYLGSETDLGTYSYRNMETDWLDHQASHTVFGGEVASDRSTDGTVYNSVEYATREMFKTHTSYLNIEWNDSVINEWKNTAYTGSDPVYQGESGFTYINNHLGYRFVLRGSVFADGTITAKIENVGAGNVVNPKTVTLNIQDASGTVTVIPTSIDVRSWTSQSISEINIAVPETLADGTYTAYLQIDAQNGAQIRFANDNPFGSLGNCIGSFAVTASDEGKTEASEPTEGEEQAINTDASLYSWNLYLLSRGSYGGIREFLSGLNITRIYQEIPELYLTRPETAEMVGRLSDDHIETVALAGDRAWGLQSSDLSEAKAYIDSLAAYNTGIGSANPIRKIAFDIETYTYSSWRNASRENFSVYIDKMKELYDYAHSQGFEVVQVIPVFYDTVDAGMLRRFISDCADEVSLMNYDKAAQVDAIRDEVEICRELGIKVETIFETMPYNENYSVTEENTYFYEGFDALKAKRDTILDTYSYEKLTVSYHHFPTVYHVVTGDYLAEIYAYTDKDDATRNDLGQTEALESIVLTGQDGTVIEAGLYNPNLGAQYEENCYLAFGVKPDVIYSVSSASPEYQVTNTEKTFAFAEGDLIDYTSIRIKRIASQPEVPVEPDIQLPEPDDRYTNIGIGAGGSFFLPMIDPVNSNNYYAACDMGGLYYSYNKGNTWHRTETRGVFNKAHIAEDGTIFGGGYGLYASTDHGQTLQLIYPRDVKHQVSRCGWNENLMIADGFDNGYLTGLTTGEGKVWFTTVDWSGNLRLMSADYNGDDLKLLHTMTMNVSAPTSVNISLVADKTALYMATEKAVLRYSYAAETLSTVYTAEGTIRDFKKIDGNFFILDDTSAQTKILYTADFSSYKDLMDKNGLSNTFEEWGTVYTFDWHFKEISGNRFDSIFLSFESGEEAGIMRFNGTGFEWAFDSMYNKRSTFSDTGWSYGCHGPFYGICADPKNDNICLVGNIETVYVIDYAGGSERNIRTTHCVKNGGAYTTTGLDVQTTYSVQEDPFDPDHIIICTTDMGLQNSYDKGRTFKRMEITGSNWDIYNTCYDLYFDRNTQGLAYGLWSNRHDAPYAPSVSDKGWTQGAFAVSYDGGNTWDFSYSSGLPHDCIPVKMSVQENGDALTIAVATFNRGFYISYDSGRTFSSISGNMSTVSGLIWGEDVVLAGNTVYCLTAPYNCITGSWEASKLYIYDISEKTTSSVDLGELVLVRSLTYDTLSGLYLNVMPTYHYEWFSEFGDGGFVNDNGGIYRYDGSGLTCIFENNNGIFNSGFAPNGTMYAVDQYGRIFAGTDGTFTLYADGLFNMLKNVSFASDTETMYITTFGGGTYRLSIPGGVREEECVHTEENRNAKQPTCTEEGYTGDTYCTKCDTLIAEGEATAKTAHTPEIRDQRAATCMEEGYTGNTYCTKCDTLIAEGEATAKTAHTPEIRDQKAAACAEEGYTGDTYCTNCDTLIAEGEVTAKTAHTAELRGQKAATCTEEGYTGDTYCTKCDTLIAEGEVIAKTEHTPELRGQKAATCMEEGYTGDTYCTKCDTLIAEGDIIPETGHTASAWKPDGNGNHSRYCSECGEWMQTDACADQDGNAVCDECGYVTAWKPVFTKQKALASGKRYLIVANNRALQQDLSGTTVSFTASAKTYTAKENISEGQLWTYRDGKLYCEAGGVRYYLTATSSATLEITTDAQKASVWTGSSNRLSVNITTKNGSSKAKAKTYYLYNVNGQFSLSTGKQTIYFYRVEE